MTLKCRGVGGIGENPLRHTQNFQQGDFHVEIVISYPTLMSLASFEIEG